MNAIEALVDKLTPRQRELLEELLASRRNASSGAPEPEPVAVVGMACRFPGGCDDPDTYFRFLLGGGDAVGEIPESRFSADAFYDPESGKPGKMNTRWGGFLDDVESFDPRFFGISPREAEEMDPQQRLLLEVAHDALDDAGMPVSSLAGSATGVFVGTHSNDYSWLRFADPARIESYLSTGTAHSIVANRLSYLLDLHGPSLAVDTACSSSLVGIHLACRGLKERDCDVAIAAGVNVILSPHWSVAVSQLGMLSPDGHCRAFDHRANGFVRSEGCGVVVLKRLSDARTAGDRIYALVRGSFVNQDGRTNGLTAPSGLAQRAVVQRALEDAGVAPGEVGYVEAHGTGTPLGDPIEVEALGEALAGGSPALDGNRILGSVKSNLGHLEAAAGMAGFIKAVLALEREAIPKQIHFETLNPHIDLDAARFVVPTETVSWPRRTEAPRRAGISSFGFGGTNAHVVVEEAPLASPPLPTPDETERDTHLLVLSAKTPEALRARARSYVSHLETTSDALVDLAATASRRRDHYAHRLAVVVADADEAAAKLASHLDNGTPEGLFTGRSPSASSRDAAPVFVFSGQGPQWWGMGRELLEREAVFRESLEACDAILSRSAPWSLLDELSASEAATRVGETEIAQPALFSLQVALVTLLRHWGVEPGALIGHSVGEIAAAHVASALTLEDALSVVLERGRLMQAASGSGKMLSVDLPFEELETRLDGELEVAAVNGPRTTVVSGAPRRVEDLTRRLESEGVACRSIAGNYAFHSAQMEPAKSKLREFLTSLAPTEAAMPLFSTVTGGLHGAPFDADYWARNLREPVRFQEGIASALDAGYRLFVEVGPHPVLGRNIWDILEARGVDGQVLPTLRRGRNDTRTILETLGALHVSGVPLRFEGLYPSRPPVSLPRYPFSRERFPVQPSTPSRRAPDASDHPLLGGRTEDAVPVFEARVMPSRPEMLGDHRWNGRALFPAAAYLEMALASVSQTSKEEAVTVEGLAIDHPLLLDDDVECRIQLVSDGVSFRVFSTTGTSSPWTRHVSGNARAGGANDATDDVLDVEAAERGWERVSVEEHYERAERHGVHFGESFRTLRSVYRSANEVLARIDAPSDARYRMHPGTIDAGIQALHALLEGDRLYLPIGIERFVLRRAGARVAFSRGVLRSSGAELASFDLSYLGSDGRVVAQAFGLKMKRAEASVALPLYTITWRAHPERVRPTGGAGAGTQWLLVGGASDASAVERVLRERGEPVSVVSPRELEAVLAVSPSSRLGVVHLAGSEEASPIEPAFETVSAVVRHRSGKPTRLWIVGRGGQAVSATDASSLRSEQAPLSGLVGTLALEHPELRPVLVDLDASAPRDAEAGLEAGTLGGLLAWDAEEPRIAVRARQVFHARLTPVDGAGKARRGTHRLKDDGTGSLDGLRFVPAERTPPADGEVTIEVEATGLNFRDVLAALDLYPGRAGAPGNECSGRVVALGAGASGFEIGDRVVAALVPGSFASHVNAAESHVVGLPDAVSFREGAAVPIAFLTARHGLETCAAVREGERVLIHAGAGGVGMAAIQIAKRRGARVLATAGSETKRQLLRSMGVEHVADSRSLGFAEDLREATGGEGVDVVLNSLSGPFIPASLGLLRPGGRFVEIGKRDVWTKDRVASVRDDVRYDVFDLEEVYRRDPETLRAMLVETFEEVRAGRLTIPTRAFPVGDVAKAFRFMAEARHAGKIVVQKRVELEPSASYLVTGGLGALGLRVSRWLAEAGARRVILASRRALDTRAAEAAAEIEALGVEVKCLRCDVSREDEVRRLFQSEPGIRGVVHAAGVLEDGLLGRQDAEAFRAPFGAKAGGASNLDRVTRELGMELDFFVLFSSMASVVGSVGQAGYASASAFLDALAQERRASGLAGTSLSWGPWSGDGMASGASGAARYRERGIRKLDDETARASFERAVRGELEPHVLVLPVEWSRFLTELPDGALFYRDVAPAARAGSEVSVSVSIGRADLAESLKRLSAKKARELAASRVSEHVTSVLGLPADEPLDPHLGFRDAGLDSLMAVEVRNRLRGDLPGLALPTTLCFDFPNVESLTAFLLQEVGTDEGDAARGGADVAADRDHEHAHEREVEGLTEEEAEALLLQELEGRRGSP